MPCLTSGLAASSTCTSAICLGSADLSVGAPVRSMTSETGYLPGGWAQPKSDNRERQPHSTKLHLRPIQASSPTIAESGGGGMTVGNGETSYPHYFLVPGSAASPASAAKCSLTRGGKIAALLSQHAHHVHLFRLSMICLVRRSGCLSSARQSSCWASFGTLLGSSAARGGHGLGAWTVGS